MLAALATSHKIGIAVVAGVFIVFALASSFLLPSWRPDFPGRRVKLFVAVAALLTAGMLASVIALAGEPKEKRSAVGETTTAAGTTTAGTTTTAPAVKGDPAAGKTLFTAQGCVACHTFKPAGATAKVGPDLANIPTDAAKANRGTPVQYVTESIKNPTAYTVPGFPKGVMPSFAALSDTQIADLVAFLATGSNWAKG